MYVIVQGFFKGGGWRGGICHPLGFGLPPLGYAENSILHVNQFKSSVPDSTKLHLIKGSKSKFPGGACPRNLLVCHMLCTQIHTCPPYNPDDFIWPSLGQKAERNSVVLRHPFTGSIKVGWYTYMYTYQTLVADREMVWVHSFPGHWVSSEK